MIFEELGFRYIGPVDGHDLDACVETMERVKDLKGPILVHVLTQKGKGYALAEENPFKWHGASPFDKITGQGLKKSTGLPRYQKVFGRGLVEVGERYPNVVAITAAMPDGTSTDAFSKEFPERFFDVGIAEGHGVTMAAGMATQGVKPVVAIYSTFLQRAYDSIVHDVALQDLAVVFCMDRAGIAGEDGPTHHGVFDIGYMLTVPGMTVTAPKDGTEMLALLRTGIEHDRAFSIRWPRDSVPADVAPLDDIPPIEYGSWEILREGSDIALLAVGTMVLQADEAARQLLQAGIHASVVNCRYIKPHDQEILEKILNRHDLVLTIEEGSVVNGFGAHMARVIGEQTGGTRVASLGIPDRFIQHGARKELLAEIDLDVAGIVRRVKKLMAKEGTRSFETA